MMRLWRSASVVLILVTAILWAATDRKYDALEENSTMSGMTDPAFMVDVNQLDQAVSCPVSVSQAKETALLVHGTGITPQTNWEHTLLPPLIHAGFQPCYVAVPHRLLFDIQTSADYISYAIKKLAQERQISIISWSAGALVTQWTLTFYPDSRSKVKRHIALGPDYRGSWTTIPLVYFNMYTEALDQQLPWSGLLTSLARFGGITAHVPTTSIGSSTDLIVQPVFYGEGWRRLRDTWRLDGPQARNFVLFKLCATKLLNKRTFPRAVSHDSLLWEPASHKIIFDALANEQTYLGSADGVTSDLDRI